jgi:phosphoribosylformylglycinamidine cyclo-ligase
MHKKVTYKDAGVDIDNANLFINKIKPYIRSTNRKEVRGDIGGYAGLFHLDASRYKNPILVSSTDGVGTKLKIAIMMDKHDTIGIDLVAMSVNDIIVKGAEPLFFLDYLATSKLDVDTGVKIIEGIAKGCSEAGCALIGGETAEMPGFYKEGDYDLAGFCVGVVEAGKMIDGSEISVGDKLIGLASSGLHSNGYSMARKIIFEEAKLDFMYQPDSLPHSIGIELLKPTRIYVKPLLNLLKQFNIKGLIHITGGGFFDNIPRVLPEPCRAVIRSESWPVPEIFRIIQNLGNVEIAEMYRVFNMGIGMIAVVSEKDCNEILERLAGLGEKAFVIGTIEKKNNSDLAVEII